MYLVLMTLVDPEAFLRAMVAPLSAARSGESLPGVPFSVEAVANAFVMLGLLPEPRAEEILAGPRLELETKGFRIGVVTGELSVRPGAHGYQDAQAGGREDLARIPLAVAAGPVPITIGGGDLNLTWATLTPGGVRLRFRATGPDDGRISKPRHRPYRVHPGSHLGDEILSGVSVADNLGRRYRLRPESWRSGPSGRPGEWTWNGEMLAEPEPEPEPRVAEPGRDETVRWLEFASASGPAARVVMPSPADVATGPAEPPWPTPAECYLAVLASARSMSIGTVELDTAQIVAAVADALLWVGALPPDSALLSGGTAAGRGHHGWQESLVQLWGRQAHQRARNGKPERAGLAVGLPLRQATAVIEGIAAHDDLVSIQLYGHPWVSGEYWPMITPCFQVRAVDDTGGEHEAMPGSGGGSPEGSRNFWFWPPVDPAAKRIRVIVSTLWEAAWAEIDIPGRSR